MTPPDLNGAAVDPRVAVVIPAGPADDAPDTVASVLHYLTELALVVVVDDTNGGAGMDALRELGPPVTVIPAPNARPGKFGGLWTKICAGFRYALENAEFDLLIRMDADALMIGPGLAAEAARRFAAEPGLGMLGSYRIGPDGGQRDFAPAERLLSREIGPRGLRHPGLRTLLGRLVDEAREHGYVMGEHALGGLCVARVELMRSLSRRGLLDSLDLELSRAGEDHIFALLCRAAGFSLGDFGGPGDPLALRWKGLPSAPEQLLDEGRLATHSVRFWQDLDEREIRQFFAKRRTSSI